MLLATVDDLIFPRMLMWASLKLAKPAPHSLVLARMEACVVIVMAMMRGVTLVVVVISPTKVQLQAVRALMVNFGAKHHYKDNDVCIKHHLLAKHPSFSMDLAYILKYRALISIP